MCQASTEVCKGVYVIPSLFTIGNIFCGFYAVINSLKAYQVLNDPGLAKVLFNNASVAIGIAYLLDGLDGRIARLTHATSEFGVELDSIADVISFGIAPAVLAYTWGYGNLPGHEQLAWGVSFFFLICGAKTAIGKCSCMVEKTSWLHFAGEQMTSNWHFD